jgi:predicted  nucleic acid-binding Zn-ribbon protein
MPHKCVHCGKFIGTGSKELLDGCTSCGGRFFLYLREEQLKKEQQLKEQIEKQVGDIENLTPAEKEKVEADVREILNVEDDEEPVILDIESVRVISPGKFEIDLTALLNKKPVVFKLQEGKYMIDLESSMPVKRDEQKNT